MNTITSFGIILYTIKEGKKIILICKRIASLQYLDIFNNRCPISKVEMYVQKCTPFEKEMLRRDNFNDIYNDSFSNHREYEEMAIRWKKIRPHVQIALKNNFAGEQCCMYSFPKGKKKYGETPEDAALREFEEETRISVNDITKTEHPPYTVSFKGSDDKFYKTVYYVYKCDDIIDINKHFINSPFETRQYRISEEMEELLWVPIDEVDEYLEPHVAQIVLNLRNN